MEIFFIVTAVMGLSIGIFGTVLIMLEVSNHNKSIKDLLKNWIKKKKDDK